MVHIRILLAIVAATLLVSVGLPPASALVTIQNGCSAGLRFENFGFRVRGIHDCGLLTLLVEGWVCYRSNGIGPCNSPGSSHCGPQLLHCETTAEGSPCYWAKAVSRNGLNQAETPWTRSC